MEVLKISYRVYGVLYLGVYICVIVIGICVFLWLLDDIGKNWIFF